MDRRVPSPGLPPTGGRHGNIVAMCGRCVVADDPNTLISGFSVTRVTPFSKRWNVTPMSDAGDL